MSMVSWLWVAAALAVDPVSYTPFDLAEGRIELPKGHGLTEGEQDVEVLMPGAGDDEAAEACRLVVAERALEKLPGRRCAALWRAPVPPSLVISVDGSGVPLGPDVTSAEGKVTGALPKADSWAGYDRNKHGWSSWTGDTIPEGVIWALSVGEGEGLYAKNGGAVQLWAYDASAKSIEDKLPEPPPVVEVEEPPPPPPPSGRESKESRQDAPKKAPRERPVKTAPSGPADASPAPAATPMAMAPMGQTWRYGAVRIGLGGVFGDAVDHGYDVRTVGSGTQGEVVRTAVAPVDLDVVVGYAPFFLRGGRDPNGCGRAWQCIGPFVGLSVAGQAGTSVEWLKAAHLGAELELTPSFALQLTGVARRVTRLAEGYEIGSPAAALEPPPTVETFGLGGAVLVSATPRWGR